MKRSISFPLGKLSIVERRLIGYNSLHELSDDPWKWNEAYDRTVFAAATTLAAIAAYTNLPLLKYADLARIGGFGFLMAVGVAMAWFIAGLGEGRQSKWLFLGIAAVGGTGLSSAIVDAARHAGEVAGLCRAIELDMVSPVPKRAEDPTIFRAIGFDPQGITLKATGFPSSRTQKTE